MTIVAGQAVANTVAALRAAEVKPHNDNSLTKFQMAIAGRGYREAEIVKSLYGYSLRFASGLDNFGLIASSRSGQLDGSWESAVAAAERWCAQDPSRRWVTTREQL